MRTIKLRAWLEHDKRMLSGDNFSILGSTGEINWTTNANLFMGQEYKLMQFTGLLDKNGKEIFEGDIVEEDKEIIVVEYGFQDVDAFIGIGFNLWPFKNSPDYYEKYEESESALRKYEVIGNIYENPELLVPSTK